MMNTAPPVLGTRPEASQRTANVFNKLALESDAIVFSGHRQVGLDRLALKPLQEGDLVVDVDWSGISTGTERLLWSGDMPPFPGLAYPLVPGYESVGRVVHAEGADEWIGEHVFVPGANCYEAASGLFGASASRVVIPAARAVRLCSAGRESDVLLALAATAHHAVTRSELPELIIGHGVLGQLVARLVIAMGGQIPTVWETNPARHDAQGYKVCHPQRDTRRDYKSVCDVSGNVSALDTAIAHSARGGEIVLAGFYAERVSFEFPAAFMRELSFRIAAEWRGEDMDAVLALQRNGRLSLDGLVTHIEKPGNADAAYQTAFNDASCLKMLIEWGAAQ